MSFFKAIGERFQKGSVHTKLSFLISGYGNFTRKQIVKGFIYLFIQIAFILFMVLSPRVNQTPFGFQALLNLSNLGTNPGDIFTDADNSLLMLLFGVVTIGMIGLFIINYLSNTKSSFALDQLLAKGKTPNTFRQDLKLLLDERFHVFLLTPSFIAATIFTILPTLFMILIAFTNFDVNHQPPGQLFTWVGFQNFVDIFDGSSEISVRFIPVLSWTMTWAVIATFSNYFAGIMLAMLINQKAVKFKTFWRTIFVLTIATPQFISLLAVRNLLSLDGPINQALLNFGLIPQKMEFLTGATVDANVARISILFINLWVGIPYTMLMTSGILMNIPKDLYEAATVDGANRPTIFFKITLPYIIFVTTPYLISSFIGNITSFNIIYLLTGGGPAVPGGYIAGQTDLLVTWLYKLTVEQNNYNLGSVIGIMTFILTATGTLITYRRSKTYKEEEAFQL
jgi:arabinogalactan oligomer / maltooligosaccharide transport system permease protein